MSEKARTSDRRVDSRTMGVAQSGSVPGRQSSRQEAKMKCQLEALC